MTEWLDIVNIVVNRFELVLKIVDCASEATH